MPMNETGKAVGARELKRRETLRRITDTGICLFIEKGVDGTTIDEIAEAAGISRRTFFHYFESKDDILLSLRSAMSDRIVEEVRAAPKAQTAFETVRLALLKITASIPSEDMVALDRMMRGSASVQARKQASYAQHEQTLYAALRERWPEPGRDAKLRLVAMVAVGALRLATEIFYHEEGKRSFAVVLSAAFDDLKSELLLAYRDA